MESVGDALALWNTTMPLIMDIAQNKSTNDTSSINKSTTAPKSWMHTDLAKMIPLYVVIFFLSVTGNLLVIFTLVFLRRMRTITNLFLLNLSISDLFLGVFCMPFTLVGSLLRNFIFGNIMCKMLPYFQGEFTDFGKGFSRKLWLKLLIWFFICGVILWNFLLLLRLGDVHKLRNALKEGSAICYESF
jgi:hypothetical protein